MKTTLTKNGMHQVRGGMAFYVDNLPVYGFRIKPKGIPEEQRKKEIEGILKATDDFAKNNKLCIQCSGSGVRQRWKCHNCDGKGFIPC